MSQPSQRGARCSCPGKVDNKLGEFWVENPWDIVAEGHNLSAYERKRTWLNVRGKDFLDVSFLSGADNDGDGRCVVAADFRNVGRLDLVVRQVGGGAFLLYANEMPQKHFLKVSLRGTKSNRLGIGARLTARTAGLGQVRELWPANSYHSQAPCMVHFGLGDASQIEELTIRWPSGHEQVFRNVAADRHILIDEGKEAEAAIETVLPGRPIRP